uniref:Major sperm protein n=1 Tax=Caenorhabditis japonica TaxID=281687 RepID=A0A8R1HQU7_CAEJA
MTLKNTSTSPVCFKVKTTAPKQYCVRPNSGLLKSGEEKQITVMLQPIEGAPSDAARHKFMVQSCVAPHDDIHDLESIWKIIDPTELNYTKLMVTFVDRKNPASGDDDKLLLLNGQEETFASAGVAQELGSSYNGSQDSGTVASLRKSLKSSVDVREELQSKVYDLEHEIEVMRVKNRQLQQSQTGGSGGILEGSFPSLQVFLIAVAALLIGLIFGRLF